jgi:DNA-binding transcriptional regulator YdaS (Cro superfamily)
MDLKTYIEGDRGRCTTLAATLGVSPSYLSQMAGGRAAISPARCVEIERATAGQVTRQELRPDDWSRIWPELQSAAHDRRKDDPPPPAPQSGSATEGDR